MEFLMELLKIVIMIVVPVATSLLTYYAQKYFNQLIDENVNDELEATLEKGFQILMDSVNYVQQTYVDSLKQQDKFTAEAQKEAFELAKKRAIELMNQHTQDAITHIYGNLDTYIDTMIESIINQNKKGSN